MSTGVIPGGWQCDYFHRRALDRLSSLPAILLLALYPLQPDCEDTFNPEHISTIEKVEDALSAGSLLGGDLGGVAHRHVDKRPVRTPEVIAAENVFSAFLQFWRAERVGISEDKREEWRCKLLEATSVILNALPDPNSMPRFRIQ